MRIGAVLSRAAVPLLLAALASGSLPAQQPDPSLTGQRIKDTVHNLSVSGPGAIRAASETEVCVFCHTPHGSSREAPLWNRSAPAGPYLIYQSSSLKAQVGQPTGSSKLCLSCHDGTIALGSVLSRPLPIVMAGQDRIPPGPSNLGTDLADDHPISFPYSTSLSSGNPELLPPETIQAPVSLDRNGELQCRSCHEPHDNTFGKFLVRSNDRSAICTSCHRPLSWDSSGHAVSAAAVPPGVAEMLGCAAGTVSQNACRSCHRTHGSPGRPWILGRENISRTCVACHDGTVAQGSIQAELVKVSNHGVIAEAVPIPATAGEPYLEGDRVSCGDCHNPHAAGSSDGLSSGVPPSLSRVAGVRLNGVETASIAHIHELCFRCHGDSYARVDPVVSRQIIQLNKRLQFQPNNPSFHPVGNPGVNPRVPSLIPPLNTGSTIGCEDCHDADDSRKVGGTGPAGPHGSILRPLLARRYDTADNSVESPAAYALCYGCHQRESILRDDSFKEHRKHIVNKNTPCSACHDAHGIYSGQGNSQTSSNLINFDRRIVYTNRAGKIEFVDTGLFSGRCSLNCHGEEHEDEAYSK